MFWFSTGSYKVVLDESIYHYCFSDSILTDFFFFFFWLNFAWLGFCFIYKSYVRVEHIGDGVKNRIRKPWVRPKNYENCLLLHSCFCGLKLLVLIVNLNCRIRKVFEIANVFEFVFFTLIIANIGGEGKIVFH